MNLLRSAGQVAIGTLMSRLTGFVRTLALAASTRLLEAHRVAASEEMADALEIGLGEPVVQLKRLRLGNGLPIGIQTSHLPEARVAGLYEDAPNVQSLYAWLKERCDITPVIAGDLSQRHRLHAHQHLVLGP